MTDSTNPASSEPINELIDRFRNPPRSCRPMPQWSWNEDMTRKRISETLKQFADQGCGGLFMHARPGIMVEYLSERWFKLWTYAMHEAERLGLEWQIYDEFTAAGGNAGGYATVESPHATQREITVLPLTDPDQLVGRRDVQQVFVVEIGRPGARRVSSDQAGEATGSTGSTGSEGQFRAFALIQRSAGFGSRSKGLAPVDLFHPDSTRAFIRTTHDKYAQWAGEGFGTTVRFVFNDEPHVNASRDAYPYSPFIAKEFYYDHGYSLEDNLDALCFWEESSPDVRYDYYRTLNRLYNRNFAKPLYDWCEKHDLEFTGHYMEHEWPRPISQPDTMASLRWMQAPGNDLLGFQFTSKGPQHNGIYFLNLKELSSVANQYDRRNVMVESCGGAGYDAAFDVFKPTEDYLLAFGVNIMDPHLSHYSIVGARKYDFAQTLSDHSSWWPYYRRHADHVARVIAAMENSREANRTLVLHPTTTGWLYHQPAGYPWNQGPNGAVMDEMRADQISLLLALYGAQVDFDLGDEMIIEEVGGVQGGRLRVGSQLYDSVVIPRTMETWTTKTATLVGEFLKSGGVVYQLGDGLARVDGRRSDEPAAVRESFPHTWIVCRDQADLVARLRERTPPYITAPGGQPLPDRLVWRRSALPDGSQVFFFCNPWQEPLSADVLLPADTLVELDTATGEACAPSSAAAAASGPSSAGTNESVLSLRLEPRGHRLIIAPAGEMATSTRIETRPEEPIELEFLGAESAEPNRMIVDFCDFAANGRSLTDVNTVAADRTNWQWQGWNASPWLMAGGIKPFRSNVFRAAEDPRSSFKITYRFSVGEGLTEETRSSIELLLDRPEHYTVTLNRTVISSTMFSKWFDVAMGKAPIGDYIIEGENVVEVEAVPFNTLCEVAPIYLLGDFALKEADRGFEIVERAPLTLGDWTKQGRPFYPAQVTYRFKIVNAEALGGKTGATAPVRLSLGDWAGSVLSVSAGGAACGQIMHPPYELDFELPVQGEILELTVVGNMRNMIGPFFTDGVPVSTRWAAGPEHMPPGSGYRFQPSGLFEAPSLRLLREKR